MSDAKEIEVLVEHEYAGTVADELVTSIGEVIEEKGSCSLCLSGGTTPASIFRLLGIPPRSKDINWSAVKVFWGDERWVPHDHAKSNFRMANETLLDQLIDDKPQIFPIDTSLDTPELAASKYSEVIKKEGYYTNEDFTPSFDIVLLGVGTDGHFASVFPGAKFSEELLCFDTVNPEDNSQRITLSPNVLCGAERIYVLAKGESKSEVLQSVLHRGDQTLPISRVLNSKGRVLWFLDQKAAGV